VSRALTVNPARLWFSFMARPTGADTMRAMRIRHRLSLTIGALCLVLACPALAQRSVNPDRPAGAPQRPGEAVDQSVGDLGPKITSFRQVQPGLGEFSSRAKLYRRRGPADWQNQRAEAGQPGQGGGVGAGSPLHLPQSYVRETPGVRAYVDQPQYLTRRGKNRPARGAVGNRDDRFRQIVTPNTVYDLIPKDATASPLNEPAKQQEPEPLNGVGERYRREGTVSTLTTTRSQGRLAGKSSEGSDGKPTQSARARRQADRQRRPARDIPPASEFSSDLGANHPARREKTNESSQGDGQPSATQPRDADRFGASHPTHQRDGEGTDG